MKEVLDEMLRRRSIATASFLLLDVEVIGHVLDNGMRVIEANCVEKFIRAATDPGRAQRVDLMELQRFSDWQEGL